MPRITRTFFSRIKPPEKLNIQEIITNEKSKDSPKIKLKNKNNKLNFENPKHPPPHPPYISLVIHHVKINIL